MARNISILLSLFFSIVYPDFLSAQDSTIRDLSQHNGFSQLSFDREVPTTRKPKIVDPEQILKGEIEKENNFEVNETAKIKKTELKPPQKTPSAQIDTPVKVLLGPVPELSNLSINRFLAPSLSGPKLDVGSEKTITSNESWKGKKGDCSEAINTEELCNKARALEDVYSRFSGEAEGLLSNSCDISCQEDKRPTAVALTLANARGGAFAIEKKQGSCHYKLSCPAEGKWLALEASKITCACLPKSCLVLGGK